MTANVINQNKTEKNNEEETLVFKILSTFHTFETLWMTWFTPNAHKYSAETAHISLVISQPLYEVYPPVSE